VVLYSSNVEIRNKINLTCQACQAQYSMQHRIQGIIITQHFLVCQITKTTRSYHILPYQLHQLQGCYKGCILLSSFLTLANGYKALLLFILFIRGHLFQPHLTLQREKRVNDSSRHSKYTTAGSSPSRCWPLYSPLSLHTRGRPPRYYSTL
jgi:hypothetical protein